MKINTITKVAVLAAIAAILQHMTFFPKVGGFLEIEISDFPAIIAALALGPVAGVFTELIKNLLHTPFTSTAYVGEFANFVVNGIFVLVIGLIYRYSKTKKGAIIALLCGTVTMTVAATLINRYLLLPMFAASGAPIEVGWELVLKVITPFNFVRGIVLCLITFLSYKKLRVLLK